MSDRQLRIEQTLSSHLPLAHLEVFDESGGHNVPVGAQSHFKVVLVSQAFEGESRINRHRTVNSLLQGEFDGGMHALAIHPYTEEEWRKRHGNAPMSPPCHGGEGSGGES